VLSGPASERVKTLWLPGLATFFVSMSGVAILLWAGVRPLTFFPHWHHPWQFFLPWLASLPLLGALGAYWSGRAGGKGTTPILAAVFPVIAMSGFGIVALVADLIGDVGGGRHSVWHSLCGFGYFVVCWLLAPGTALLLGAFPVARLRSRKPSPHHG